MSKEDKKEELRATVEKMTNAMIEHITITEDENKLLKAQLLKATDAFKEIDIIIDGNMYDLRDMVRLSHKITLEALEAIKEE